MYGFSTRKKILSIKDREKLSIRAAGKRFALSPNTIFQWSKGIVPKHKRQRAATKLDMEGLKVDVERNPDASQYERAERFKVSQNCIYKGLKRLCVSYKKNFTSSKSKGRGTYFICGKD